MRACWAIRCSASQQQHSDVAAVAMMEGRCAVLDAFAVALWTTTVMARPDGFHAPWHLGGQPACLHRKDLAPQLSTTHDRLLFMLYSCGNLLIAQLAGRIRVGVYRQVWPAGQDPPPRVPRRVSCGRAERRRRGAGKATMRHPPRGIFSVACAKSATLNFGPAAPVEADQPPPHPSRPCNPALTTSFERCLLAPLANRPDDVLEGVLIRFMLNLRPGYKGFRWV